MKYNKIVIIPLITCLLIGTSLLSVKQNKVLNEVEETQKTYTELMNDIKDLKVRLDKIEDNVEDNKDNITTVKNAVNKIQ